MRIAVVFPGQGSHRPGMASVWQDHPLAAPVLEDLSELFGWNVVAVGDDAEACAHTALAQPALFAVSVAAWTALAATGLRPVVVAGHSLGEITAAVAAGSLAYRDAAVLVSERGRAMADACTANPGGMVAVLGLELTAVEELVADLPGVVVANDNAPGQVVVAGPDAALGTVAERVRALGGRTRRLPVEGAFHSPAMTPALVRVDRVLRRLPVASPDVLLVSGATGEVCRSGEAVRRSLTDGIVAPVRWRAVQQRIAAMGVDLLIEVGPGGVLTGLLRRTVPGLPSANLACPEDLDRISETVSTRGCVRS